MSARYFSGNESVSVVVLVLMISSTMLLHSYSATCLATAALCAEEQASSSNNNADKEIAFVYSNGSLRNDSQPSKAAAQHNTAINDTTVSATSSAPTLVLKRDRRYLDLVENTRMSLRFNAKNGIIPNTTLWAHSYGFRLTFPIQNDKRVRPFRRDTYETLGDLMDKSGFDGQACVLKAFCAAHIKQHTEISQGMLFKLLKYIFTLSDDDKRHFPYLKYDNCHQILHSHCPLSFNNISPFTDDV